MRVKARAATETFSFRHGGFFLMRCPLLPFSSFQSDTREIVLNSTTGDEVIDLARDNLRMQLTSLFQDPVIQEAIFTGSTSLHRRINDWLSSNKATKGDKTELALIRYLGRMSTRSTPFGLFANVGLGRIGQHTSIQLDGHSTIQRHTRLDNGFVADMAGLIAEDEEVRDQILYFPNSSIHIGGQVIRYVEYPDRGIRKYKLAEAEKTPYLTRVLELAARGSRIGALASCLENEEGVSLEEARDYLMSLIESRILVSELEPLVTGGDALDHLQEILKCRVPQSRHTSAATRTREMIGALNESPVGASLEEYEAIRAGLTAYQPPELVSRAFQVDSYVAPHEAVLSESVVKSLLECASVLHQVDPIVDNTLDRFKKDFKERYENSEAPLAEVLDDDSGIGFEPEESRGPIAVNRAWESYLVNQAIDALSRGQREVVLDTSHVSRLPHEPRPAPNAIAVRFELAIEPGRVSVVQPYFMSTIGSEYMGRFAHGHPSLVAHLKHLADQEAASFGGEVVLAEITHLPQGRTGNVICRPAIRKYEIPYLGKSGVAEQYRIPISDLMVSVTDGEVVLRSRTLNKRVLPRLASAHSHARKGNLTTYRFLAALQAQGGSGLGFRWPIALLGARYLPRVRLENVVLARARWCLNRDGLGSLRSAHGNDLVRKFCGLREELAMPRLVSLRDGDNVLPVDFDNVLSVENAATMLAKRESALIEETYPMDNLCVRGPGGGHSAEFVVPFLSTTSHEVVSTIRPDTSTAGQGEVRNFLPTSEWIYLKLYGAKNSDELVLRQLKPKIMELENDPRITRWFLMRYRDPFPHLRLRILARSSVDSISLMPFMHRLIHEAVSDGLAWKAQFDTYQREVERYGGFAAMDLCETLFHADSKTLIDSLEMFTQNADQRGKFLLMSTHQWFEDFGVDLGRRISQLAASVTHYSGLLKVPKEADIKAGARYRAQSASLVRLLAVNSDDQALRNVFVMRSGMVKGGVDGLKRLDVTKALVAPLDSIVMSVIHMSINRLLPTSHDSSEEWSTYDLLRRHYQGVIARARASSSKLSPHPDRSDSLAQVTP